MVAGEELHKVGCKYDWIRLVADKRFPSVLVCSNLRSI